MSQVLNIGLLGYGMAGQAFHAPVITSIPGLNLKTVFERNSEKAKESYPWVEVVHEVNQVFADETIDCVVIATPNDTHFEYARQALLAGKHVVVEKPFTVTSEEADQLIQLAQRQNRILTAFQNRRWDGDFLTVQKIIEQQLLGELVEYEAHYDRFINSLRPNTWKEEDLQGSGIVYDLGSHLLDQAQVLFGLPRTITAQIRKQRKNSVIDDQFEIVLDFDGSFKVTLKASMLVREAGPHFILHGTHGSFIKYGLDPQEAALKRGMMPNDDPCWGSEPEASWGTLNTTFNGLHYRGKIETVPGDYRAFYQNVFDAVTGKADLLVKPEHARNTIRMIELAYQSHQLKRTVEFTL